ncbi:MAG: DNA repair protein RecN [Caldilineaceae bacterium]|nr:DNA repair protein RecN [Caldilineaceae bacterium]
MADTISTHLDPMTAPTRDASFEQGHMQPTLLAADGERAEPAAALSELQIRDFAIIDRLHLRFHTGLNILTGETGAGKSIIIDAIGLLLGDRATAEMVRAGADRAEVEAVFQLEAMMPPSDPDRPQNAPDGALAANDIPSLLEAEGLDDPDAPERLILSREVRRSGRNFCRINGRTVSRKRLSELASLLVDIHGQGEHLNLLRPRTHVDILDRYGDLLPLRRKVAANAHQVQWARRELERMRSDARTIAQRLDLLSFQAKEISEAALEAGEERELEVERKRLSNAETLLQLANGAANLLNEGEGGMPGVTDVLSEAVGRVESLARIDDGMGDAAATGQGLLEELSDLARDLQGYADGLEFNPQRLVEVEERLALIENLKRKYGDTTEEILAFAAAAQAELEELDNWEAQTAALEEEEERLLREIGTLGAELSQARVAAGEKIARQVEAELEQLSMQRARFAVAVEAEEQEDGAYLPDGRRVAFGSHGVDQVEFLISANPGEPVKPLARVASGGETARLMLALKGALTQADQTPILIFDEIDQGIGGRVGGVVGEKLWNLTGQGPQPVTVSNDAAADEPNSKPLRHQVLCITHLPQLAAFADFHLTVRKRTFESDGELRTGTDVLPVEGSARIEELTQMLGAVSDAGRQSVVEMLAAVNRRHSGGP